MWNKGKRANWQTDKSAKGQKCKRAKGQKGKKAKGQGQIWKVNHCGKLGKVILSEIRRLWNSSHVWGTCNQCYQLKGQYRTGWKWKKEIKKIEIQKQKKIRDLDNR